MAQGAAPSERSGGSPQVDVEVHRAAPALRAHEAVVCMQRLGPDAVRVCERDAAHACTIQQSYCKAVSRLHELQWCKLMGA